MAVAVWPDDLPQCVLPRAMSTTEPDGRLRTSTDTGPGKSRLRNSAAMMPATLEFVLSPDQVARLMRFWREDLGGGVLPFVIPDPWFDGRPMADEDGALLADETGAVLELSAYWLAMFDGAPTIPRQSRRHGRVSVGLLVFPG